jgi:poly-gamma-glutamate synthesis protein (capsule biosynthesis protein)
MRATRRSLLAASLVPVAGCLGSAPRASSRIEPPQAGEDVDARIGFVGDVMFGRGVNERWSDGPPAGVGGSTAARLRALDGLVLNLECCVSERGERRPGLTYYFRADPGWAVPALDAVDATVSLANNHVLDYGPVALEDTLDHLASAGVGNAGAGRDLAGAIDPATVDANGVEVACLGLTDRSPSYGAGPTDPGTAFVAMDSGDPRTRALVDRAVERAESADPDLLVASLHWGPNWEVRPSGRQQAFARWLVERGVDVVHGHSAHVVQGVELYRGRPIVHDAGDFVDDYAVKPDLHNDRSVLFELEVTDGRLDALRLVPIEIRQETAHRARPGAARWLRDRMRTLSDPFGTTFARDGDGLQLALS